MDAGVLTFQQGSMFDPDKTWHFMCLSFKIILGLRERACTFGAVGGATGEKAQAASMILHA